MEVPVSSTAGASEGARDALAVSEPPPPLKPATGIEPQAEAEAAPSVAAQAPHAHAHTYGHPWHSEVHLAPDCKSVAACHFFRCADCGVPWGYTDWMQWGGSAAPPPPPDPQAGAGHPTQPGSPWSAITPAWTAYLPGSIPMAPAS
jgi:hypothetical protein